MIDLDKLENYRENNRIEAKKALGGFPRSVWETYSAFANTLGGIILLGVEEYPDRSLHAVDLPAPEKIADEFWNTLNDRSQVSVNILSHGNIRIEETGGKRIVVITVPRAQRYDRPVYIGENPFTGSYRRNGEGDYRCPAEEVKSMMYDASAGSADGNLLENAGMDALDFCTVRKYRRRMETVRPGHVWEKADDGEFLYKLGALGKDEKGDLRLTSAGLLTFGCEYEIIKEFPRYFLDYRDETDGGERLISCAGDWSGNLFDFYFSVRERLAHGLKLPQTGGRTADAGLAAAALGEALTNCILNADYRGRQGVVIVKGKDKITFSNPGTFRMDIAAAKCGGVSDPRNTNLSRMFNLISIGGRSGSGIPSIYSSWHKLGLPAPAIEEKFEPARTVFTLPLKRKARSGGVKPAFKREIQKERTVRFLTDRARAGAGEIAEFLEISVLEAEEVLGEMIAEGIVTKGDPPDTYALKR